MTHQIHTSSSTYQFTVYPADMQFNRLSGIYIFLIIPPMAETLETTELIRSQIPPLKACAELDSVGVGGCENQHPAPCHPEQACAEPSRSIEGSHSESHSLEGIPHPSSRTLQYSLLYVGITNNFYARLKQHHKIELAKSLGMTHIGILKIPSGRKRKKIEREILKYLNPPLNQTWLNDTPLSSLFGG